MKSYSDYKETNNKWLPVIPKHWELVRLKYIFKEVNLRSETGREQLLSLTRAKGLVPFGVDTDKLHSAETLVGYKICKPGQMVMNRMQAWSGMFCAARSTGLVSPDYTVFEIVRDVKVKFFEYLLKNSRMVSLFHQNSKGVGDGFLRLYTQSFGAISTVLPPREEQNAIVDFLEVKEEQINKFVANKRRTIELLKEQKAALINRAVTRGLNPDPPHQYFPIIELQKIPAHWEIFRTKEVFRLIVDVAPKNNNMELLSVYTEIGVKPRKELEEKGNRASTTDGYFKVKVGDIVVNKLLAWMGAIGVSNYEGVTSPAYDILRAQRPIDPRYYHYLFRTGCYFPEFKRRSRGIMEVRLRLYFSEFGQIPIPYPPVEEQGRIAEFLEQKTAEINALIQRAENEIRLIEEYRASLIDAAVTGKMDVRREAACAVEI